MILGFISFTLALLVEFGATIPYDLLMAFEWAHFLVRSLTHSSLTLNSLCPVFS